MDLSMLSMLIPDWRAAPAGTAKIRSPQRADDKIVFIGGCFGEINVRELT